MYIYELEKDEIVNLTVRMKDHDQMEWRCPVVETSSKGRCILVPPLKYDDKVLTFETDGIVAELVAIRDGKPFVFIGCHIQYIKTKNVKYHAVICKGPGVNLNRRSHFRVSVDEYCYVNNGKATIDALVTDMSASGFAFVVGKYDGLEMDFVKILYTDTALATDISVMGRVVRRVDREDGKTLFGCYMSPRPDVEKYVAARQRSLMKRVD